MNCLYPLSMPLVARRLTPTFVLPHKRYATFEVTKLCRKVVEQNQSLRTAVSNTDGRPVFYAEESSRVNFTVSRWKPYEPRCLRWIKLFWVGSSPIFWLCHGLLVWVV